MSEYNARVVMYGALSVAAAEVNHGRRHAEHELPNLLARDLQALEQVIAEASANLLAGRSLFAREDGTSSLEILSPPSTACESGD